MDDLKALENEQAEEFDLDYETTYGFCLAKNPYWFIPDLECNTEKELLSWRHALFAVKQGTFNSPEHYFWKECDGIVVHGHNSPWGMGISAFSDKINVWEEYPFDNWLLELAESQATDEQFIDRIKDFVAQRKLACEKRKSDINENKHGEGGNVNGLVRIEQAKRNDS